MHEGVGFRDIHGLGCSTDHLLYLAEPYSIGVKPLVAVSFTLLLVAHIFAVTAREVAVLRAREPELGPLRRLVLASLGLGLLVGPHTSWALLTRVTHRIPERELKAEDGEGEGVSNDGEGASHALAPFVVRDYWHVKRPSPPEIPGKLEMIWTFKNSVFREFIIIDDVAEMNSASLSLEDDGCTFVITNVIGKAIGNEDRNCGLRLRIRQEGDSLFKVSDDGTSFPLERKNDNRQLFLNIESLTGEGQGPEGRLGFVPIPMVPDACCRACFAAHCFSIHCLDCLCCYYLGGCGFSCCFQGNESNGVK